MPEGEEGTPLPPTESNVELLVIERPHGLHGGRGGGEGEGEGGEGEGEGEECDRGREGGKEGEGRKGD